MLDFFFYLECSVLICKGFEIDKCNNVIMFYWGRVYVFVVIFKLGCIWFGKFNRSSVCWILKNKCNVFFWGIC